MVLPELPVELWDKVSHELYLEEVVPSARLTGPTSAWDALKALRCCSKTLNKSAGIYFFRDFPLLHSQPFKADRIQFHIAIAAGPFAKNVKALSLQPSSWVPADDLQYRIGRDVTKQEADALKDLALKLPSLSQVELCAYPNVRDLVPNTQNLFIELLEDDSFAPGLRKLHLDFALPDGRDPQKTSIVHAKLQRLKSLDVRADRSRDNPSFDALLQHTSQLESLKLHVMTSLSVARPPLNLALNVSTSLHTLNLGVCSSSQQALLDLVARNPAMARIYLTHAALVSGSWEETFVALSKVGTLEKVKVMELCYVPNHKFEQNIPTVSFLRPGLLWQSFVICSSNYDDYHALGDLQRHLRDRTEESAGDFGDTDNFRPDNVVRGFWYDNVRPGSNARGFWDKDCVQLYPLEAVKADNTKRGKKHADWSEKGFDATTIFVDFHYSGQI